MLEVPESSTTARWLAILMPWFIISSVLVTLIQSVEEASFGGVTAASLETAIDSVFLLEAIVRFLACPNQLTFFFSFYNFIDLAAAAPFFLRAATGFVLPDGQVSSICHGLLLCAVP